MTNIILYPHGGSGNHGCEAIVRSTLAILNTSATLFTSNVAEDAKFGLDTLCELQPTISSVNKNWLRYAVAHVQIRVHRDSEAFDRLAFYNIFQTARKAKLAFSIGGDNYCYGVPKHIMFINRELRKRNITTLLWGCSIEPSAMDQEMLDDLRGYKLIISRESLTTNALKSHGLNNVIQAPDPAFILKPQAVELPSWWKANDTVGINASPMILDCSADSQVTLANYESLIEHILETSQSEIALIPHVIWDSNDDRKPLQHLLDKFGHTGRVHLLEEEFNAEQLKYIISKCRVLITARTHASIAAYSTGVPTIVMGYSVKARGIALDLFGKEDEYVLPVQNLSSASELKDMYNRLISNEQQIRSVLTAKAALFCQEISHLKTIIQPLVNA